MSSEDPLMSLWSCLQNESSGERAEPASQIAQLVRTDDRAVNVLRGYLNDSDPEVRVQAGLGLLNSDLKPDRRLKDVFHLTGVEQPEQVKTPVRAACAEWLSSLPSKDLWTVLSTFELDTQQEVWLAKSLALNSRQPSVYRSLLSARLKLEVARPSFWPALSWWKERTSHPVLAHTLRYLQSLTRSEEEVRQVKECFSDYCGLEGKRCFSIPEKLLAGAFISYLVQAGEVSALEDLVQESELKFFLRMMER